VSVAVCTVGEPLTTAATVAAPAVSTGSGVKVKLAVVPFAAMGTAVTGNDNRGLRL